ncbi:MAG: CARDB domain-containing protein, partial [archaeon]
CPNGCNDGVCINYTVPAPPSNCDKYGESFWCSDYNSWKLECQGRGTYLEGSSCTTPASITGKCVSCAEPQCHNHISIPLLTKNDYDIKVLEKGCTDSQGTEYLIELKEQNHPICGIKLWVWRNHGTEPLNLGGCYGAEIDLKNNAHVITVLGPNECFACRETSSYGKNCTIDSDCSSPLRCKTTGRYSGSYRQSVEKYCCNLDECASSINAPCVRQGGTDIIDLTYPNTALTCVYNQEKDQSEYIVDCEKTYGSGYWCGTYADWNGQCNAVGAIEKWYNREIGCGLSPDTEHYCIRCTNVPSTCTNTDQFVGDDAANLKKLRTKGTCTDAQGVHVDVCEGSDYLIDYTCEPLMQDPKHCGSVSYNCKAYGFSGCLDGACVSAPAPAPTNTCTDSDGGPDYYVKGYVNLSGYGWDYCKDTNTLIEQDCGRDITGGVLDYGVTTSYTCPAGCYDGACINETAKPDLVVRDIYYDGSYFIKVKYCNIGSGSSDSDFLIKLRNENTGTEFPGNRYYRFKVPAPGMCELTGGYTCSLIGAFCGDYINISATIDWEGRVNESNENNNVLAKTIGSPNYVCTKDSDCGLDGCKNDSDGTSLYTVYDCMYQGTSRSKCISYHVETDNDNDGYDGECNDCNDRNPTINPGATEICTDWIDNDCDDLVDGKDPDCSKPDLTVENIDLYLSTGSDGIKRLQHDVTIKNRGNKDTGAFKLQFYLNDLNGGDSGFNNLGPGQTFTNKRGTPNFKVGENTLKAIVDYDNTVDESNENNNILTKTIIIPSDSVRESTVVWKAANSFYGNVCEATVDCPAGYIANGCGFDTQRLDGTTAGPITEFYRWAGNNRCSGYFENLNGACSDFRIQAICLKDTASVTELWQNASSFYGNVCEAAVDCPAGYIATGCGFDTQRLDGTTAGPITEFYRWAGKNRCSGYFENQNGTCSDFRIQAICLKDTTSVTELWQKATSFYGNVCEATVDCPAGYIAAGCGFDTHRLDGTTAGPITEFYRWGSKDRCGGYFENRNGSCSDFRIQGICLKAGLLVGM